MTMQIQTQMQKIQKIQKTFGIAALCMMSAVGCGGGHRHRPPPPPPGPGPGTEMAQERRDDARDRRFEDRTGWEKVGERMVNGGVDHDVIAVTRAEGRFQRISIVVEHSSLEMFDIDVEFGNGERFSPGVRHVFGENTRSRVIDLPGDKRVIKFVHFKYGNLPGGGRAQVELWAQ